MMKRLLLQEEVASVQPKEYLSEQKSNKSRKTYSNLFFWNDFGINI